MPGKPRPLAERVWSRVNRSGPPDGCWEWQGATTNEGHPLIRVGTKQHGSAKPARHIVWELVHGEPPPGRVYVLCGNPRCLNPAHLTLDATAGGRVRVTPDRFWAQVDRSNGPAACWPWMGGTSGKRWGQTMVGGEAVSPAYHAWELMHGELPKGYRLVQICDTERCVNPAHRRLANQPGVYGPGRNRGEANPQAKLTWEAVDDARRRWESGASMGSLAREYGVSASTMRRALLREGWVRREEALEDEGYLNPDSTPSIRSSEAP